MALYVSAPSSKQGSKLQGVLTVVDRSPNRIHVNTTNSDSLTKWSRYAASNALVESENAMANAFWVSVRNNISKRLNTTENDVSKNQSSADSVILQLDFRIQAF
ncbi:hypothetical protein TNCV_3603401 [Trichonephila clavipes]|nr:hypothetical protein TNCV_3603401 [Trichonephila clavipes]